MASVMVEFEHANNGGRISLFINQVFGAMVMPANGTIAVIGPNNALVPVKGTMDEVTHKLKEALNGTTKQQSET